MKIKDKNTIVLDDTLNYLGMFSKICIFCKHYIIGKQDFEKKIPGFCKAFPKGIPKDIWLGKNNHKKPYKGDNDIQFELKK